MWKQRSRVGWINEGDLNTSYFHRILNNRRQNFIPYVSTDMQTYSDSSNILEGVTTFYESLFSRPNPPFSLCDWDSLNIPSFGDVEIMDNPFHRLNLRWLCLT